MLVTLKENEYMGKDIELTDGSKTLTIMFGGTGDLYWIIRNKNCNRDEEYKYESFEITKENYELYKQFEDLIEEIKTIDIYKRNEIEFPPYVETDEDKQYYLDELDFDKLKYRRFNMSHYNDLYDESTDTVTWVSDETGFEVANKVSIRKIDDKFLIEFNTQPYIEGYEREDNYLGMMGIRFRNSGSRYDPFNIIFMRMYKNLQQIDDVLDHGHQIHIEEYMYSLDKPKTLKLNK